MLLAACAVACAAIAPSHAAEASAWHPSFTLPVSDGRVEAMYVWRDQLVVAGSFTQIGGVYSPGVATWDGSAWHALGRGLAGDGNGVHVVALTTFRGDLIAGGLFEQAGDVRVQGLARWDGAAWHAVGGALGAPGEVAVRALTVFDDMLIAGGYFPGADFPHLAGFDGATWRSLGAPPDNEISALGVIHGELVAGGYFGHIGDTTAVRVASWNGIRWSPLGGGINPAEGAYHGIADLQPYQGGILAVGRFDATGDGPASHLALFRDGRWTALGEGVGAPEPSGRLPTGVAYRAIVFEGALHATAPPNATLPRQVSRYDGDGAWLSFSNDPAFPIACLAVYRGALVAGGGLVGFRGDDGPPPAGHLQECIVRWLGARWVPIEDGRGLDGAVNALAAWRGDLIAAGAFTQAGPTQLRGIGRWDGARWSALAGGVTGVPQALAVYRDALVVAGAVGSAGGLEARGMAQWDGTRWTALIAHGGAPAVSTLTVSGDRLIAAGRFATIDEVPARNIAAWDGHAWSALGEGLDGRVLAVRVFEGELVAAGDFAVAGGEPAGGVAVWRDGAWHPFGPALLRAAGVTPHVTALGVHERWLVAADASSVPGSARDPERETHIWWYSSDDEPWAEAGTATGDPGETMVSCFTTWQHDLIVGGSFAALDGVPVSGLAQASAPATWASFNGGIGGVGGGVRALLAFDDAHLYAGGDFTLAGGVPSFAMARWGAAADIFPFARAADSPLGLALGSRSPARGGITLQYLVHADGDATLAIYDARGRYITTLVQAPLAAGRYVASWDGRTPDGVPTPSGVYVAQLRAGGHEASARFVRIE